MQSCENGPEVLYRFMTNPKWELVDPALKQRIIDAPELSVKYSGNKTRDTGAIKMPAYSLGTIYNGFGVQDFVITPNMIDEQTVSHWRDKRPVQPEKQYFVLPDAIRNGLDDAEQAWTRNLLYVVNDSINTLLLSSSFSVSQADLSNGSMNGKLINHVGIVVPKKTVYYNAKRALPFFTEKAVALWEKEGKAKINQVLDKRQVPEEVWGMYHAVGYVYVLSDFKGEAVMQVPAPPLNFGDS